MQFPKAQIVVVSLIFELFGARLANAADSAPEPEPSTTPDTEQPQPSTAPDTEPSEAPASEPTGAPPEVIPTAPGWNDPPSPEAGDPPEAPSAQGPGGEGAIGSQWFWASGKAMPGLTLRAGKGLWWLDLEASLIHLTQSSNELDVHFLGNQFGLFAMVRAKPVKRLELAAGLGADIYALWNIHGDEWQVALALRTTAHFALSSRVGLFGTARGYPLSTRGLELGTYRDGSSGVPVLFSTGIEWRLQ